MSQRYTSKEVPEEIVCDQDAHFIWELSHVIRSVVRTRREEIDELHSESEEIGHYGNGTDSEDFENRTLTCVKPVL